MILNITGRFKRSITSLFWTLLLLFSFLICPTNTVAADLQQELEAAMDITRQALNSKDYQAFRTSLDPTRRDQQMTEEQFTSSRNDPQVYGMLQRVIPDLRKEALVITVIKDKEWAAYYAETNLFSENHLTLSIFVFHQVDNQWYYTGITNSLVKARPESPSARKGHDAWKGMEHILWILQNHPDFQLENLVKNN